MRPYKNISHIGIMVNRPKLCVPVHQKNLILLENIKNKNSFFNSAKPLIKNKIARAYTNS
jgi:hypothetical protein